MVVQGDSLFKKKERKKTKRYYDWLHKKEGAMESQLNSFHFLTVDLNSVYDPQSYQT